MRSKSHALSVFAVAATAGVALTEPGAAARAAPADPAAQALFDQGRAELACAKLEESQRLAPAPGTAFNLADCYAHIGRLASAWSLFRDVEAESNLAEQLARGRLARKRADELEPLLPKLLVQVGAGPAGLELRRDGVAIGRAQWDTPVPVDIGEHVITAWAPHRKGWHTVVVVTKPAEIVVISVPALETDGSPLASPAAPPAPPAVTARVEPTVAPPAVAPPAPPAVQLEARPPRREAPIRLAPIVAGVAGLSLLAASGATMAVAWVSYHDAGPCTGRDCQNQQAVDQRNEARSLGNAATALAIAGVVGVSTAAVLWLALPPPRADATAAAAAHPRWDLTLRADGASLRGSW